MSCHSLPRRLTPKLASAQHYAFGSRGDKKQGGHIHVAIRAFYSLAADPAIRRRARKTSGRGKNRPLVCCRRPRALVRSERSTAGNADASGWEAEDCII